jgi:hypothetical protein
MMFSFFAPGSRLWTALFWVCAVSAAVLALIPQPPHLATGAFADKIEHMVAFAVLAALGMLAYPALSRLRLLLMLCAFGAGIELAQAIPALNRDSAFDDWVVDGAVTALVLAIPLLLRPRAAPFQQ